MTLSRRKFSGEFKLRAVRQVEAGASVAAVARRYEIHPTLLSKWRQQLRRDPERAFQRDREPHDEQVQVNELEQMVGRADDGERPVKKGLGAARGVSPAERRVFKDKMITLTRISNLIQTSRPSGGLERLYS